MKRHVDTAGDVTILVEIIKAIVCHDVGPPHEAEHRTFLDRRR
jgi:hypothetical protein